MTREDSERTLNKLGVTRKKWEGMLTGLGKESEKDKERIWKDLEGLERTPNES